MSFRPQPGFSHAREEQSTGSQFSSLGPLSKGDIIRRVVVHVHLDAAGMFRWGASLGISKFGTQAALRVGRSLVTQSDVPGVNGDDSFPHIGVTTQSEQFMRFEFFPGMRVTGPSGWIQVHSINVQAGNLFILSTFEIARWVTDGGETVGS